MVSVALDSIVSQVLNQDSNNEQKAFLSAPSLLLPNSHENSGENAGENTAVDGLDANRL